MNGSAGMCSKAMMLRFDSYENRVAKGELQTFNYRYPFQFESLDHLLMIMDDVMDSIGFSRKEGELRHLKKGEEKEDYFFQKMDQKEKCTEEELQCRDIIGFHNHLTVLVNRREHSSMQGTILLNEDKIYFRSALELMHILHEYLESHFQRGAEVR